MNNTKKRDLSAMFAILMAATLVVGTAGTLTKTAFAASNSNNGNTVTIEECKNKGSASGFDTALDQECENLICTHPGPGATCVSENQVVTPVTPPVTPPVKEVCLSAQPATVFDVTVTQSLPNMPPLGTIVCLGKTGENNPQNFPPGAAIIEVGGATLTGLSIRIDNSVNGGCLQGVQAIVDSGNPPGGFNIGDTACITDVDIT